MHISCVGAVDLRSRSLNGHLTSALSCKAFDSRVALDQASACLTRLPSCVVVACMYRQYEEDQCPDCLQLCAVLLSQAQAYVAHLGTLRPKNPFKKDDDLHEGWHLAEARISQTAVPARGAAHASYHLQHASSMPTVHEAYGSRHFTPVSFTQSDAARSTWTGAPAGLDSLAHECALTFSSLYYLHMYSVVQARTRCSQVCQHANLKSLRVKAAASATPL